MNKNFRHFEIAVFIVSLFCIVAILVMIAFIMHRENRSLTPQNLEVVFSTSDIMTIKNKLPLSDDIAKSYEGSGMEEDIEGYSTFSITNPNDKKVTYEIYLTKQKTKINELNGNYIKFYLTDRDNNPYNGFEKNVLPTFYSLDVLKDKPGSNLLYRGTLLSGRTINLKLRMWLADTYVINQLEEDFSVDIDVRIK